MPKDNGETSAFSSLAGGLRGGEGDMRADQAAGQVAGFAVAPRGAPDHSVPPAAGIPSEVPPSDVTQTDIGFSVTLPRALVEKVIDRAIKRAAYEEAVRRGIKPPCNETEFLFQAQVSRYRDGRAAVTMEV